MAEPYRRRRRRRPRRRGPGALLVLLCVVLISAAVIAAMTVFFKIENINVEGETRYSDKEIISAMGLKDGENMFLFNKFAAISRAFAACPYLEEISVRRRLPDTLDISVTECTPVAAISDEDGTLYFVDKKLKVLEKISGGAAVKTCKIEGVELLLPEVGKSAELSGEEKRNPLLTLLNSAVENDIIFQIKSINITRVFDIQFAYTDRFTVRIGTIDDLDKKIRFMLELIKELEEKDRGIIDVSEPPVARFRPYESEP